MLIREYRALLRRQGKAKGRTRRVGAGPRASATR
jgi:hypothetical protein